MSRMVNTNLCQICNEKKKQCNCEKVKVGLRGPTGPTGPQGIPGSTGSTGSTGTTGANESGIILQTQYGHSDNITLVPGQNFVLGVQIIKIRDSKLAIFSTFSFTSLGPGNSDVTFSIRIDDVSANADFIASTESAASGRSGAGAMIIEKALAVGVHNIYLFALLSGSPARIVSNGSFPKNNAIIYVQEISIPVV